MLAVFDKKGRELTIVIATQINDVFIQKNKLLSRLKI